MKTALLLAALVLLAPVAAAGPDCTCDPIPIVRCVVAGDMCPPAIDGLDLPTLQEIRDALP